jgi:hypothetical protein
LEEDAETPEITASRKANVVWFRDVIWQWSDGQWSDGHGVMVME